jgi:hypothetical protein
MVMAASVASPQYIFASGGVRVPHRGTGRCVAAIILWNTKYLEVAYTEQRRQGGTINEDLLRHVAPLGWEYIGPTGDYVWSIADQPPAGTLRPLRQRQSLLVA